MTCRHRAGTPLRRSRREVYALIAQRVTFVDADDNERQAFHVRFGCERWPRRRISRPEGLDSVRVRDSVVRDNDEYAVVLVRRGGLRQGPRAGDEGAQGVAARGGVTSIITQSIGDASGVSRTFDD